MKYRYKFTIIMSIYKTDLWLREAVESIINQDIGFEDDVQIIMVNDGSPDRSEEICLEYKEKYPHNILYIKKKNGGLSSARNEGLKHREGEYVNFFDPDDILTSNTLSEVYTFFSEHKHEKLALVTLPLVYFEGKVGLHTKYLHMGERNRVIDLNTEPYNFVLSSAGSFYETELFDAIKYDSNIHTAEDTDVNMQIYLKRPRIGYVVEKGVEYKYRKRYTGGSMVDSMTTNPKALTSLIEAFNRLDSLIDNDRPSFLNQCIIYELRSRIRFIVPESFKNKNEYRKTLDAYRIIISSIPDVEIDSSRYLMRPVEKYMFKSILMEYSPTGILKDGTILLNNGKRTTSRLIPFIKNIDTGNEDIIIEILFFNYGLQSIQPVFVNSQTDEVIRPSQIINDIESAHDIKYGLHTLSKTTYVEFTLPKSSFADYKLYLEREGVENGLIPITPYVFQYLPFILNGKWTYKVYDNVAVKLYKNTLSIKPARIYSHAMSVVLTSLIIIRRYRHLPLVRLFSLKNKKYILVSDRPFIGRDNGEAVFRHINEHNPEIAKHTYFVINKKSSDYQRLSKVGRVVAKNSFKHKYLFVNSRLILSSHLHPKFILPFQQSEYRKYADVISRKFVWLQHGITKDDIDGPANRFHQGVDGLVVGANMEVDIFSQPKYFYDQNRIIKSGFPRFDFNENTPSRIITVIPTWRKFISGAILENGIHEENPSFEETEFYKHYRDLLTDKKLLDHVKNADSRIDFILHPGLMSQKGSFEKLESEMVRILKPDEIDYQKIFSESALMVTDYSSVFFDFSYLDKPVLFYQFDHARFFTEHYKKSEYFDYEKDGVGPVFRNHEDIVNAICSSIDADFSVPVEYRNRIDRLFLYHDKRNSTRFINELKKRKYI